MSSADVSFIGNSSVVSSDTSSAFEEYTSRTMKSCVTEALEKRLASPRHLIFGDIDMVVGFVTVSESAEIEFTLLAPSHGWIGFGVSEVGSMVGADIVVVEPQDDGTFELTDRYSKDFVKPTIDKIQSWELLSASQEMVQVEGCGEVSLTTAVVRRMLDTCDAEDEKLTPDYLQNYFIAAYGEDDQKVLSYHSKRASIAEYVHVPEPMIPKSPKGAAFDILTPPMDVPSGVTNYCYSRIIVDRPLMVTAYTAVNIQNVHHIGLFKAASIDFEGDYACTSNFNGMGTPQLQWAIGTKEIVFPSGLYIKIDPGEYYYEVHFENFKGDEFNTIAGLRAYAIEDESQINDEDEIQILNLESRFASPIPSGLERVEKGFELPTECLENLPPAGVTMMVTVAHMHKRGAGMQMYRTRGDRTDLVFDQRSYDFNKQNPVWKPWTLLPGDKVTWRCFWDTTKESEPVPWGLKADEEMCSVFLAADKGAPFRYAGSGLSLDGDTFAYCSTSRPRFDDDKEIRMRLTNPPENATVVKIDASPPASAFVEAGRDRNICHALVLAEVAAPANNWLWGSPILYVLISWLIQAGAQRAIAWWCHRKNIQKQESWFVCRSINLMEAAMCWTVLVLVFYQFDLHFKVETNEVYDVAGVTPLGNRYKALNAAGDYIAAAYLIVFVLKAAYRLNFWGDLVHHGSSLMTIWLLRNAVEYEYAPSFLCFFASCMIIHSGASAPMYTSFLLLKLDPNPAKNGKRLAVLFMISSTIKQCMMIAAHVANFWNYRLFFQDDTFTLRDISTAEWNDKPYFDIRTTSRDLWLDVPWMEILMITLPILWVILAIAQFYNTWRQFKIGIFEYNKTYDDTGKMVEPAVYEEGLDSTRKWRRGESSVDEEMVESSVSNDSS